MPPFLLKNITDTIKIVHDYTIPNELNDDSTRVALERKIKNLELLNNYDKQIKEKVAFITQENTINSNRILTNKVDALERSATSYEAGIKQAVFFPAL